MSFKSAPNCAVPSGLATMDLCLMDKLKGKSSESIREFRSPLSILLSVPAQGDDDIAIKGCKSVQSSFFRRLSLCCCKYGGEYVVYFRAIYFLTVKPRGNYVVIPTIPSFLPPQKLKTS